MEQVQIIPVDQHTWIIQEETVRCFLFEGNRQALLVDSSTSRADLRSIVGSLTKLPVMLVNTHTDHDHIFANHQFGPAHMHPAEYCFYRQVSRDNGPVLPLWGGDVIDLDGRRFQVIETPGHTPGSIALLDEANRILVGGDGIQDGTIYMFGPQRDITAYLHSLEKLQDRYLTQFDLVYPSHSHCPVSAGIIPRLIDGVRRVIAGEVPGVPFSPEVPGVNDYDMGVAHVLV